MSRACLSELCRRRQAASHSTQRGREPPLPLPRSLLDLVCPRSSTSMSEPAVSAASPESPSTATPRQRLEAARAAAAAIDESDPALSARARTASLTDAEMVGWPRLGRRVISAENGSVPVLASVHASPAALHVFKIEGVAFSGERHCITVTATEAAVPTDEALRPAFAAMLLDNVIVAVSSASPSGAQSDKVLQLSLAADVSATWVAS